ncbi:hypothetical protein BJF78_19910 [Pseudonocardia sp. CNS-139]|nr:hypothetical protein BJF78_19910 [Pseudonocardia sp. CNS-139]
MYALWPRDSSRRAHRAPLLPGGEVDGPVELVGVGAVDPGVGDDVPARFEHCDVSGRDAQVCDVAGSGAGRAEQDHVVDATGLLHRVSRRGGSVGVAHRCHVRVVIAGREDPVDERGELRATGARCAVTQHTVAGRQHGVLLRDVVSQPRDGGHGLAAPSGVAQLPACDLLDRLHVSHAVDEAVGDVGPVSGGVHRDVVGGVEVADGNSSARAGVAGHVEQHQLPVRPDRLSTLARASRCSVSRSISTSSSFLRRIRSGLTRAACGEMLSRRSATAASSRSTRSFSRSRRMRFALSRSTARMPSRFPIQSGCSAITRCFWPAASIRFHHAAVAAGPALTGGGGAIGTAGAPAKARMAVDAAARATPAAGPRPGFRRPGRHRRWSVRRRR